MPRRFRSAFILFSSVRHKEIRNELSRDGRVERVSVAERMQGKSGKNALTPWLLVPVDR